MPTTLIQRSISIACQERAASINALAKEIGISANQLGTLYRGKSVPSLYNLQKLAKHFGWGPEQIGEYVLKCDPEPTGPKKLHKRGRP